MMARLLCLALMLFLPATVGAQSGHIAGTITQGDLNTPLPGANISLRNTFIGAASGHDGQFYIGSVPAGAYWLSASSIGFKSALIPITVVPDDTLYLSISLAEQPVEIAEIIVERIMMTGGNDGVLDIPGSAHYVNAADLEKFSFNDINRILRAVPGVNIQEEDGYGLRPNIGMRGTGVERSSKITLMEDGVLMAPAPYAAPAAYYFPTAGRMQGVEVRKGSSQIKFGPYTTGGAINLISTQIPDQFGGQAKIIAGSNDDRTLHAHIGDAYEQIGFLVETYQTKTSGFKKLEFGGETGFDKKDYLAKVRLNTKPSALVYQALTLKASQTSESSNETYLGITDADFNATPYLRYAASQQDVMKTNQQHYIMRHVIRPNGKIDLTTTLYRTNFGRNWYKLDRVRASTDGARISISDVLEDPERYNPEYEILRGNNSTNDNALEVKNNNRDYYAQGIQTIAGFTLPGNRALHELEIGVRYHIDEVDRYQWVDLYRMGHPDNTGPNIMQLTRAGTPGTDSNRITRAKALASHIQYRMRANALTLTPGLRFEHITMNRSDFGKSDVTRAGTDLIKQENTTDVLIPGLGVDYKVTEELNVFAGVHKGFAPPGPANNALPEKSVNYEAGLRYQKKFMKIHQVIFFSDYTNLLGSDLAAAGAISDPFNGGAVHAYGLEFSLHANPGQALDRQFSLPLAINYTFSEARFQNAFESDFEPWGNVEEQDHLPYLPRHQLTLSAGIEKNRYAFDTVIRYMDRMRTKAGQGPLLTSESTDAHLVIDFSSSFRITQHVGLFLSMRNATNQTYIVARRPAGVRPGLPRLLLVGVKATF